MAQNHPIQIASTIALGGINVLALALINRYKKTNPPRLYSWETRRNAYWVLVFVLVSVALLLDVYFPIDTFYLLPIKQYIFAFPLGLLDLYFSDTKGVPMLVVVGAALWCSTNAIRELMAEAYFGKSINFIQKEYNSCSVSAEMIRYAGAIAGSGLLSDLFFSPLHRMMHNPKIYTGMHKIHHGYTNKLTSLVLYHGHLLDDFLMPVTTSIGGFLYILLLSNFGLEGQAFSNVTGYLIVFNTLLSHAHDIRCARLLCPLPDSMNFVAYHFVHHLSPSNNFGLTEPSDKLWDYLLGVNTILQFDDVVRKQKIKAP